MSRKKIVEHLLHYHGHSHPEVLRAFLDQVPLGFTKSSTANAYHKTTKVCVTPKRDGLETNILQVLLRNCAKCRKALRR
jgi:hypothetical protein